MSTKIDIVSASMNGERVEIVKKNGNDHFFENSLIDLGAFELVVKANDNRLDEGLVVLSLKIAPVRP